MDRYRFFRLLGEAVYRIDGAYDDISKNVGIKPNMLWILSALNDGQKHTQSQICWDWHFPKTTVNTLIKELEKNGYAVLSPVPGKKRELYIELTPAGKTYANHFLEPVYKAEEELFEQYFKGHETDFVLELHRFSDAMKQHFSDAAQNDRDEHPKNH